MLPPTRRRSSRSSSSLRPVVGRSRNNVPDDLEPARREFVQDSRYDLSPMSRAAQRKSGTAALPVKPPMAEILTAGLCHYLLKTPILGPASGR